MKKALLSVVLTTGLLFTGNQIANAERIDPEVDTTYNKYIEEYLVDGYQENMIFTKIYIDRDNIGKVIKVDGTVDCYAFKDDTTINEEKKTFERGVPVSLWESKFTSNPKIKTDYILVVKRNYLAKGGYLKSFEPVDIIEISKPKKTFPKKTLKLPIRIKEVTKTIS